jgi:hypothetical protein
MAFYVTVSALESAGAGWRAAASSARERMSSLANAWVRWVSTVRGVTYSRGDGPVAEPAGGQFGDAVLGRGERAGTAECAAPRPGAGRVELLPRAPGQSQHAAAIRLLQRAPERVAGVRPPVGPARRSAEGRLGRGCARAGPASRPAS